MFHGFFYSVSFFTNKLQLIISQYYYPAVLVIVQKARETSTNVSRYCTVGYCTVPCAHSITLVVFFQATEKRLKKVTLDNKSLIRCFGVKYRRILLLVVCI